MCCSFCTSSSAAAAAVSTIKSNAKNRRIKHMICTISRGRRHRQTIAVLLAATVVCLSNTIFQVVAASSRSYATTFHQRNGYCSRYSSSRTFNRFSMEQSAFSFALLTRSRRRNNKEIANEQQIIEEPSIAVAKINGHNANGSHKINGDTLKKVNGDTKVNGNINNGHHINQDDSQINQYMDTIDIIEDEPYVSSSSSEHAIYDAYDILSSKLSSSTATQSEEMLELEESVVQELEDIDIVEDEPYVSPATSHGIQQDTALSSSEEIESSAEEDEWRQGTKRNARSIDEGIRFKTQLRNGLMSIEKGIDTAKQNANPKQNQQQSNTKFKSQLQDGLEVQSELHRKKLLSEMLNDAMSGTTNAISTLDERRKNIHPLRWLGFGKKDKGSKKGKGNNTPEDVQDTTTAIDSSSLDGIEEDVSKALAKSKKKDNNTNKASGKNRQYGARTIAGLIMALAEEVEGLEVEIDADANTPLHDKTVNSIKIYFSRLGFRQLRMGGLDDVFTELETSMTPSERFAMATSFFNWGSKSTTADEAFDKIDVDGSGTLDEEELAEALKMAALIGGNAKFGMRSKKETLTELASRLVKLYDVNGDGVVDREEYEAMVQDMAALKESRAREENHQQTDMEGGDGKRRGWFQNIFRGGNKQSGDGEEILPTTNEDGSIIDVTDNEEFWGSIDQGEGSIVLEDLHLDLRRLLFGAIPGVKRVLPGGPLILKPFTTTLTASFTADDLRNSVLLDSGLRRLVARALNRRVRGIRDLLDGAIFYGRTWKLNRKDAPLVEVSKLTDVHFDKRDRLVVTGRAKIQEALGYKHKPIEQGFKLRCRVGTRDDGRIIGLQQLEIAIFFECNKEWERNGRAKVKEWFGYTIPTFEPLYTYIPLISPIRDSDKMAGFNMGEDNQIKSIYVKNGKLRFEMSSFLRPGRFLGNHYLAFTVPNRTLILTLGRVRDAMRNARRNKRLAELAAREVRQLAEAQDNDVDIVLQSNSGEQSLSPESKVRIRNLEKELKVTKTIFESELLNDMVLKEFKEDNRKSFIGRFVEGYSGSIREEVDLELNARLSSSISDFFGSQGSKGGGETDKS